MLKICLLFQESVKIIRVDVRVQKCCFLASPLFERSVNSSPIRCLASDVLLYVSQHVLHVIVLRVARVSVMVGATPVAVRSRRELHIHYRRVLI